MADKPTDKEIIDDRTEIPPYNEKREPIVPWPSPRKPGEEITGTLVAKTNKPSS